MYTPNMVKKTITLTGVGNVQTKRNYIVNKLEI